jgi:hypothetical protein
MQQTLLKQANHSSLLTVVKNETSEDEKQFIDLLSSIIVENVLSKKYEKKRHYILTLQQRWTKQQQY